MSKLPDTLAGCEALLELISPEYDKIIKLRYALLNRIADIRGQGPPGPLPERRARRGDPSPTKSGETE